MFKINKFIGFWVIAEGMTKVINKLSMYGTVRVRRTKDGKGYIVGLYCSPTAMRPCLNDILGMSQEGVMIRDLDIRFRE